ncbi:MAG: hypothetical protein HC807_06865 [Gammaproteobacteria bacterium]|nr:hypothetical protein [Gammaproteobacteria bacterium]
MAHLKANGPRLVAHGQRHFGVGCGVDLSLDSRGRLSVAGDESHPVNRGMLCYGKGRYLHPGRHGSRGPPALPGDAAQPRPASRRMRCLVSPGPRTPCCFSATCRPRSTRPCAARRTCTSSWARPRGSRRTRSCSARRPACSTCATWAGNSPTRRCESSTATGAWWTCRRCTSCPGRSPRNSACSRTTRACSGPRTSRTSRGAYRRARRPSSSSRSLRRATRS